MNFTLLATISLLASATGAQARRMMRATTSREVKEVPSFNETEASLLFNATVLGASIAKWKQGAGATTSSNKVSSSGGSSSKSKYTKPCDKRLALVQAALLELKITVLPEEITAICAFQQPTSLFPAKGPDPNLGCPAPAEFGFYEEEDFEAAFGDIDGRIMRLFVKYCECRDGYELDCINKIPYPEWGNGPMNRPGAATEFVYPGTKDYKDHKEWGEYCKFAGIWNGDIDYVEFSKLDEYTKECGCYFVTSSAKDIVDGCPGVDLFEFYVNEG